MSRRIPIWCRSGIDAVIIADATTYPDHSPEVERTCRVHGAMYLPFPPSFRDTRAKQRNRAARLATTDWIVFQDDDDDIIADFDHAEFDRVTQAADYLWDGKGTILVYHRRENYLRLGGQPEDMALGVDLVFSWLVRATSVGNLESNIYRRLEPAANRVEVQQTNVKRAAAMFWYGLTYPRYLERSPPMWRKSALMTAAWTFIGLWGEKAYRRTAPLGLALYGLGLLLAFPWHWIRKAVDPEFRGSLAIYRNAWPRSREGNQHA